jgi:hypothetical protein
VCGEPIELRGDPPHWIHSPGSDTHCLDARPAPAAQKLAHPVPAEAYAVWTEQTPAADEDALRTTRRDQLGVLLSRAGRGVLTTDEAALLRQHVEAEMRDVDTARAVAAGNKRHVQVMYGELTAAQAAIERVRALHRPAEYIGLTICADCSSYDGRSVDHGTVIHPCATIRALDGTEQPTP